jgi:hypothetical protein
MRSGKEIPHIKPMCAYLQDSFPLDVSFRLANGSQMEKLLVIQKAPLFLELSRLEEQD